MDYASYRQPIENRQEPKRETQPDHWKFFKFDGHVDLILLLTMITMIVFGLVILWSASYDYSLKEFEDPYLQIRRQLIYMVIGIAVMGGLSVIDYHQFHRYSVPLIVVTILFLLSVFVFGGNTDGDPNRTLFGGRVQPSEMGKIAAIIYLSVWLNSKREDTGHITLGLLPYGMITAIIATLIWMQPDNSAAITVTIMAAALFFLGGKNLLQFLAVIAVFFVIGYVMLMVFSTTGQTRISDFVAGLQDPFKSADHVIYAFEAIVNGGFFGVGLGNSVGKYTVLPFESTDSIFAVIVEELGFIGATATVGLYGLITWRGFTIAKRAQDMLGSLIAVGLTIWLAFEASINMLSVVGWFPFAGNALPFISYGGSNLLVSLAAVGILFNISRFSSETPTGNTWSENSESTGMRGRNRRRSVSGVGSPDEFEE